MVDVKWTPINDINYGYVDPKEIPTNVILKCLLCGEEHIVRSTNNSFVFCNNKKYEVGILEYQTHECDDGRIGLLKVIGLEPIEHDNNKR